MKNVHAATGHWRGPFDEGALQSWASDLRSQLAKQVSLGLVFIAPRFFSRARQILDIVRIHGQIPLLAGCSSGTLIAGSQEIEESAGIVLGLYSLPGSTLRGIHFKQEQVEEASSPAYWHLESDVSPDESNGWLVFADPFHMDTSRWLAGWNEAYAPVPILGGLASGDPQEQLTQVYLDGDVHEEGGVAISIGGGVGLKSVISQGCTPIGDTWTITKAEKNLIHEIGNRPAYEVLAETFGKLPAVEQEKVRGNLFVGLVINEYLEEFRRGDFLIRNLLGGDPQSGILAIGEVPRIGQTIQFQRRDAAAATDDLRVLLGQAQIELQDRTVFGGCLCSCNGRGQHMFGAPSHDAKLIQEELGPLGLTGFFCNGEIGPVGGRSFLHGYTASLSLFVST